MKKILITLVAIMSMFAISVPSMASAYMKGVYLYGNQAWSDRMDNPGTRTGKYSYVKVNCHSVYPVSGLDTFRKMHVRLADYYGSDLSADTTLTEGTGDKQVDLLEGYLDYKEIYYEFRGNSNSDAYAEVSYYDL